MHTLLLVMVASLAGHTRCMRCMERCLDEEGCWPKETWAGKDCDYEHPKDEGPPRKEP